MSTSDNQPIVCLFCGMSEHQVRAGMSQGLQRYKCGLCRRRYTPDRRARGYPEAVRGRALELADQGESSRAIARTLAVSAQTVSNWLHESRATTPPPTPPLPPEALDNGVAHEAAAEDPSPGWSRATIHDVARHAGVSTTTISNFLNDKGHMGEETRSRIETAIEKLHYTPSALVRAIRRRHTRILGVLIFGPFVLVEDVGQSITTPILAGVEEAAAEHDYNILIYTRWPNRPSRFPGAQFLDGHIDGLLWVAPQMPNPMLDRVAAAGLPIVSALSRHVPAGVGYVNIDNADAIRLLVRHLVALGRRRIAYVGPIDSSNFLDRRDAYRQALAEAGVDGAPEQEIMLTDWEWTAGTLPASIDALCDSPHPPTAILAANDLVAMRVMERLQARGLRFPEDVAISGFDDIPGADHFGGGLTTIRQPFREIGQRSVERLIALIEGTPVEQCRLAIPGSLVVRYSTVSNRQP